MKLYDNLKSTIENNEASTAAILHALYLLHNEKFLSKNKFIELTILLAQNIRL